jgi:nucleotide-binding universal stress UspA family protein
MKTKRSKESQKDPPRGALATPLPTIRRILTTTDFSDASLAGVRYAVDLGVRLNASVEVVYVVEPAARMGGMEAVVLARPDSEVTVLARARLEKLVTDESKGDGRPTSAVGNGKPWDEIGKMARASAVDLIVIATHGHTGIKHVLLGSTAERVVRHAPCPVLTVPAGGTRGRARKAPALKLRRILVPIDFSKESQDALPHAALLAREFAAEIALVHVIEHLTVDSLLGLEPSPETLTAAVKEAEAELEGMAASLRKATGATASAIVRDGAPFQEICATAKALDADLVAISTRGQSGLTRVVLGSTAERVVRHAPCPVLAVRKQAG